MSARSGLRKSKRRKRRLAIAGIVLLLAGMVALWQSTDVKNIVGGVQGIFSSQEDSLDRQQNTRGKIYDRNFKELAVSLERVSVYARTREVQSAEDSAEKLSSVLAQSSKHLLQRLKDDSLRVWLAQNISQEQEESIRSLALPGIYLHKEYSRFYPQKTVAAHLLGFVEDDIGLAGVEYHYDRLMRELLAVGGLGEAGSRDVRHLLLTIDLKIQNILEKLAEDIGSGRPGVKVGVYAMDAVSGALIAGVQFPSFNPNSYRIYPQERLENLLLKPMLVPMEFRTLLQAAAGLQNQYESRGTVLPWGVSISPDSLGGELRLWDRLGFEEKLPPVFINDKPPTSGVTRYEAQEESDQRYYGTVPEQLSPLKLLTGLSSLVNGGSTLEPYLVESAVADESETMIQLHPPTSGKGGEVVAAEVTQEISSIMGGMGKQDTLGGGTIAGVVEARVRKERGFGSVRNELYFTALPLAKTEMTLLVTIQGSTIAVPTKTAVTAVAPEKALAAVISKVAILQQVGKTVSDVAEPVAGATTNFPGQLDGLRKTVRGNREQQKQSEDPGKMPELVGLSLRKSLRLLQDAGCQVRAYGTGRVVSQSPSAGSSLAGVKECKVYLQKADEVSLEKLERKND